VDQLADFRQQDIANAVSVMPHFVIELGSDGVVSRILRDGAPHAAAASLDQVHSVVTTYFRMAQQHLSQANATEDSGLRREHSLQAFLMSLTGLEAFTNTYFHLRGLELDRKAVVARIGQTHGSLTSKLRELIALTGDPPLPEQDQLLDRIHEWSQLRHGVMHPRWQPASLLLSGATSVVIEGLVENQQRVFEDPLLSREAYLWCLLMIARVAQSRGIDVGAFLFRWTSSFGITLEALVDELGLATGGGSAT
jgi:hypothetical protein